MAGIRKGNAHCPGFTRNLPRSADATPNGRVVGMALRPSADTTLSAEAAHTVRALQKEPVMHRWLSKLLAAYRPAAQCRAWVEGWPSPDHARSPQRPHGWR